MKKFQVKAGVFCGCLIGFIAVLLLFQDQKLIEGRKKEYLVEQAGKKLDLMILGSSRAEHTFNPKIYIGNFEIFNIGEDGHGIPSNYLMLKIMVEKYGVKPERLLLQTDEFSFNGSKGFSRKFRDDYFVTDISDPEVFEAFKKYRGSVFANSVRLFPPSINVIYTDFKKFIKYHVLSYKKFIPSLEKRYRNNINFFSDTKGYQPTPRSRSVVRSPKTYKIEEDDKSYFMKIVSFCRSHNIKLYLYRAPVLYCNSIRSDEFDNFISDFAKKNAIPFYDYKCQYQWPHHYFDQTHSDDSISRLITRDLLQKLGMVNGFDVLHFNTWLQANPFISNFKK